MDDAAAENTNVPAAAAEEAAAEVAVVPPSTVRRQKEKQKRHVWDFDIHSETYNNRTHEKTSCFPFLNDKNQQDYILLNAAIAHSPWAAPYKKKGEGWDEMTKALNEAEADDGKLAVDTELFTIEGTLILDGFLFCPFDIGSKPLALAMVTTIKTRLGKIEKVVRFWQGKDDGNNGSDNDTVYDDDGRGTRSIRQLIRDAAISYVKSMDEHENEAERKKAEDAQKQWAEKGKMDEMKAALVGRIQLHQEGILVADEDNEENGGTPVARKPSARPKNSGSSSSPGAGLNGFAAVFSQHSTRQAAARDKALEIKAQRETRKDKELDVRKLEAENMAKRLKIDQEDRQAQRGLMENMFELIKQQKDGGGQP